MPPIDQPNNRAKGQQNEAAFTFAGAKLADVQALRQSDEPSPFNQPRDRTPPAAPSPVGSFWLGLRSVSMYFTRHVKETDLADKDGQHVHVKQAPSGETISTYDNGKKIYEGSLGGLSNRSERNPNGDGSDAYSDSNTKAKLLHTFKADGSASVLEDSSKSHIEEEWGRNGKFAKGLFIDKRTGVGTATTVDSDGMLVFAPLKQT